MNDMHNHDYSKTGNYSLKDFMPLIIIFLCIGAFTIIKQYLMPGDWHSMMYDAMAAFFIIFGLFKIIKLKDFAMAYAEYDLIAKRIKIYGFIYPFIELSLGILYLGRWNLPFANWATLIILLISATGVAIQLAKGQHIVCACLGTVFKIPMTYVTLLEDLIMAAMALIMIIYK
ncbi:MAG TPA: MauE/DoxX family redox-associated membrane protein [Candidatus Babeliales bacterium]|nr:MauE/DoxX family redox-associated membrane protein [Candidatus Babeliales bacterium]